MDSDSLETCCSRGSTSYVFCDDAKVVVHSFIAAIVLDSNIGTISLKPICYLIKCIVVATPINNASLWTFFFSALPGSTSACTVVALIDYLRPSGIDDAIVLTRTFTFPHTGTQAVIEESRWTLAARLAVSSVTLVNVQIQTGLSALMSELPSTTGRAVEVNFWNRAGS